MAESQAVGIDEEVEFLKAARGSSASLKIRLINLRSDYPNLAILVVEGDEDRIVYSKWLHRIDATVAFEMLFAGGKREVRKLKNSLEEDLNGLDRKVFFVVDRDFDDLAGFVNADNVFMTDRYSFENYLVSEEVVEYLLSTVFPCAGRPDVRQSVRNMFRSLYDLFLEVSAEINRRIFIARRLSIEIDNCLPKRVSGLAIVDANQVSALTVPAENLIDLGLAKDDPRVLALNAEFATFSRHERYRGKFAFYFFKRWLECLSRDCVNPTVGVFAQHGVQGAVRSSEMTLGVFASVSPMPLAFGDFVAAVRLS